MVLLCKVITSLYRKIPSLYRKIITLYRKMAALYRKSTAYIRLSLGCLLYAFSHAGLLLFYMLRLFFIIAKWFFQVIITLFYLKKWRIYIMQLCLIMVIGKSVKSWFRRLRNLFNKQPPIFPPTIH